MRSRKENIFYGIDWVLVLFYLTLILLGWINIYAATINEEQLSLINFTTEYGKQLIWICLSIPLILMTLLFDAKFYEKFASIIYIGSLFTLLGLFILGKNINGATSWYSFGGFSLQPAEFAKAATALAMAKLVSDKLFDLKKLRTQIQAFVILFLPAILITLQPDPGSALVYGAFIFVLYREGLPFYYISIGILAAILFLLTLYFGMTYTILGIAVLFLIFVFYMFFYRKKQLKRGRLKIVGLFLLAVFYTSSVDFIFNNVFQQHHQDRFNILLGKTDDIKDIGYNANQSVITIASGGLTGKGFLQGEKTKGDFVPEQQTDYIFTTVGEEWGFLGTSLVVLLFVLFLLRIIRNAERQKAKFSRVYGYSIAALFFTHFAVNIGMVIGILPTIGIPLPFFSYGGSSLWGYTILLFIFIRLDANRKYEW